MNGRMMNQQVETTNTVTNDFPQPTTKLQALMNQFRGTDTAKVKTSTSDPITNVQIVSQIGTKSFEELTPEQQRMVLARIANIDYTVSADIQTFGSTNDSPMTKNAETIIAKYNAHEFGELSDPVTDLVATLKTNNPKEVVAKVKVNPEGSNSIFASMRDIVSLKNARKKMVKLMYKHASLKQTLDTVGQELKKQQVDLFKDITVYEKMTDVTFEQIYDFELDCIALDLMIEEAEEKLKAITSKGQIDQMEAAQASKFKAAIDRMIRRKNTIMSIRVSAIQNIPMLNGIILGDEVICEKIDEVHSLVIPMWTWQYAIAIGHLKQQEALSIQKTIRGITSKLLTGNAKMLHDNIIAAQEELHSAAVAIEDLLTVQNYIDDMVTTVQAKSKEAIKNCLSGMKTMKEIEQKNYNLLSQQLTDTL